MPPARPPGEAHPRPCLPEGFPDRYRAAILRTVDQCAVKRAIVEPPLLSVAIGAAETATVV